MLSIVLKGTTTLLSVFMVNAYAFEYYKLASF